MRALSADTQLEDRLRKLCQAVRLPWPVQRRDFKNYAFKQQTQMLRHWSTLRSQGKSARSFADDPVGNSWLIRPSLLKAGRYLTALKMRTNSCPNRAALSRAGRQNADIECRRCKAQIETLGHILGQCRATKPARISRHNQIRDVLKAEIQKRGPTVEVAEEPRIALVHPPGGNLQPDLVVKSQERVFVVDVTVRHEDGDGLARGHQDKIRKYGRLLPQLAARFGATEAEVLPVVVGTRGAIPRSTVESLTKLGVTGRQARMTMSLIALRCSIELFHDFMDYERPQRPLRREPP